MATTPSDLTPPAVNIPFVVPQSGTLTQYGWRMLVALVNRTGGNGPGVDIDALKVYINEQIQDEREAPIPSLLRPPEPAQDMPAVLPASPAREDNADIGLLMAYIRRLESRIQHLEESR